MSALIAAHEILPRENYLKLAEDYFSKIEGKFLKNKIQHSYSSDVVFLEDYAFLINALNDLSDKTMNFKYKNYAKNLCREVFSKFYIDKKIFFKRILLKIMIFF